jgi:hypothetical protein
MQLEPFFLLFLFELVIFSFNLIIFVTPVCACGCFLGCSYVSDGWLMILHLFNCSLPLLGSPL